MSLSTSLITAAQNLINAFGNNAYLYTFSSSLYNTNDEGENTIIDWNAYTAIDMLDTASGFSGTNCTVSDNTTTFKYGTTSMNVVKTAVNVTDMTIAKTGLSVADLTNKTYAVWVYVKDAAALAKLKSSGCFTIKITKSSGAHGYSKAFNASSLAVGWTKLTGTIASSTSIGTPTATGNTELTFLLSTTAVTDTLAAGDFILDACYMYATTPTTIKVVDGGAEGKAIIQAIQGNEYIGEDEKIIRNDVTVAVNDYLSYNGNDYKVMALRSERIESTDIIKIIKCTRVASTTVW